MNDIAHFHKNPRIWTQSDKDKLLQNLQELGDISGVVHDLNSNEVPCGNFRSDIIDINSCKIEIVKQLLEPDAQGTVALGFIVWNGQRLNYRQVRWTSEQCDKACLTANSLGGDWDFEGLMSGNWDSELLQFSDINIPDSDFSILDGLKENSFRDEITNSDQFQMTFVFSKEHKDIFDQYLNKFSKTQLQEEILKIVSSCHNAEAKS